MQTMHQKVFIIGFMGAGKTTVAKKISESIGIPFFDTDAMIEEITGMSVSSIFLTWGEKYFRRMERDVIHQLMADRSSFVAALGGGSICQPDIMDWLNRVGKTVWLNTPWPIIEKRLQLDTTRPLLQNTTPQDWRNLWEERMKFYQKSKIEYADAEALFTSLSTSLSSNG